MTAAVDDGIVKVVLAVFTLAKVGLPGIHHPLVKNLPRWRRVGSDAHGGARRIIAASGSAGHGQGIGRPSRSRDAKITRRVGVDAIGDRQPGAQTPPCLIRVRWIGRSRCRSVAKRPVVGERCPLGSDYRRMKT